MRNGEFGVERESWGVVVLIPLPDHCRTVQGSTGMMNTITRDKLNIGLQESEQLRKSGWKLRT